MENASPVASDPPLTRQTEVHGFVSWTLPRLVVLRFATVYWLLYWLPMPLNVLPKTEWLGEHHRNLWQTIITAFAKAALGIQLTVLPNGSGDTTFNYVQVLFLVIVATLAALGWTVIARRRDASRLHDHLRTYGRYCLGFTMVSYGMAKVLTTQFSTPTVDRLAFTLGEMSPMGLLWTFMGYSTAYCVFTGAAEVLGGVLLFWRRTTTLGALVIIGVMVNVVMLNLCYDVPVKLFSSHLLVMAVFLTLPDVKRLLDVLVLHRPTQPGSLGVPSWSPRVARARRIAKVSLLVVGLGWMTYEDHERWQKDRDDASKPPLYGYYDVEAFYRGGVLQPVPEADSSRWKNVAFTTYDRARIWPTQGQVRRYRCTYDAANSRVSLQPAIGNDKASWTFTFSRPEPGRIILRGTFDGVPIEVHARERDMSKTELMSRGFHWINEYPHNR